MTDVLYSNGAARVIRGLVALAVLGALLFLAACIQEIDRPGAASAEGNSPSGSTPVVNESPTLVPTPTPKPTPPRNEASAPIRHDGARTSLVIRLDVSNPLPTGASAAPPLVRVH